MNFEPGLVTFAVAVVVFILTTPYSILGFPVVLTFSDLIAVVFAFVPQALLHSLE